MQFDKNEIIAKMLDLGMIERETVYRVLLTCQYRNINVLNVLANYAGLSVEGIRKFAENHFDIPALDLDGVALNPEIVRMVPREVALEHQMVPAFKISNRTHLAVANPFDLEGLNRVRQYIGDDSLIFLAHEKQVARAINRYQS